MSPLKDEGLCRAQVLAWAAALTPLAVSLAANVTWGWRTGSPILIAAGIVTPLLLVLAIERWRAMPPATGGLWWVRTLAMSGVVVVVAGWSWLHATALLLDEVAKLHVGPAVGVDAVLRVVEVVLCVLAPLAIDGLAVLSVLALDASRAADRPVPGRREPDPVRPDPAGRPVEDDELVGDSVQNDGAARGPEPTLAASTEVGGADRNAGGTWSDDDVLADLQKRGETAPSVSSLRARYGMRYPRAKRLAEQLEHHPDQAGGPDRSASRNGHPVGAGRGG